jgi:DHA1 family bicyclomycin/chloramphenicol resistance-like MFS transporter
MKQSPLRRPNSLAIYLALIAALPMISSDIFLPALPSIAKSLGITLAMTQRLFDSYFLGLALSLLVCGPISDRVGRRKVLLHALVVYSLGAFVLVFGTDLSQLVIGRCLQGLGAGVLVALWRSVAFDALPFERASRATSIIVPVMVISPALAPIAGEWMASAAGWRTIFGTLAGIGAIAAAVTFVFLPETHTGARTNTSRSGLFASYSIIVRSPLFVSFCLIACAVYAAYFLYLFQSPLILLSLGHTTREISYLYIPATCAFAIGSAMGSRLSLRMTGLLVVSTGSLIFGAGAALLITWCTADHPFGTVGLLASSCLFIIGNGILLTVGVARTMALFPDARGASSGLISFSQAAFTALQIGAMSRINARFTSSQSLAWMIAACLLVAGVAFCFFHVASRGLAAKSPNTFRGSPIGPPDS